MDIDRVLEYVVHPAIQLTSNGRVARANAAACERFAWLQTDVAFAEVAPGALAARVAALWSSTEPEIFLDGFGARLLRVSDDRRLLLFDAPQVDAFDELRSGMLVWEYEGGELRSAEDLRLVAANAASEQLGLCMPMRSFLGRTREEIGPISALSPLYLEVARTREPAEIEIPDVNGDPFIVRIFPLPGKRIGVMFEDVSKLRRAEQTFRTMFERSHEAILIFDAQSETVLAANPVAKDLFGPAGEEISGKSLSEIWRPYEPGLGARVLREGFVRYEATHLRRDREVRLDVHATPAAWRGGASVMAILRNVTAEVEAMKALQAKEEEYRSLIANLPVSVWTLRQGATAFVSPHPERIIGYTHDEVMSPEFVDRWFQGIHPDDRQRVARAYESLFRGGAPFEVEYRFRRKDGVWRWISDSAVHTYEKDGHVLASGLSQDITERKRAESQQLALAAFGRYALTATDEKALMDEACRTAAGGLEVPMVNIWVLDAEEDVFKAVATHGWGVPIGFRCPHLADRLATQALNAHLPIVYANLEEETRFDGSELLATGALAGIAAPIRGREACHGVLSIKTGEPRAFSDRDGAFVQSIANILAEAVERNRAELELEREKAQLADAQSIAHIGSFRADLETVKVEWSDELYRIFGLEPHSREVDLEWVASRMAPESRERVIRLPERFRAGEMVDEEHVVHAADGVTRVLHYRARPVTDRDTGRATIVGTVQDVTAAKQAESALRDHERRLQVIVSRLPVMLFSTDAGLHLTSLTGEGFAPMTNGLLENLSLTLTDLIGPEPAQGGAGAVLEGRDSTYDTSLGDRHLRVHMEPLTDDHSGATLGLVGIAFDVTQQKRAADANLELLERLHDAAREWRETFDSIQAPILIVDEHLRVRRMNEAALRFSRFSDFHEALDQPLRSFGDPGICAELEKLARTASRKRESVAEQHTDDDGRVFDIVASLGASSGQGGQTIIIVSEVTDVVRMQERLRRAEVMSQMGALVAGVAHEVRNPLFGISATLDAFEHRYGAEVSHDFVAALREQVTRMSQLMHELLEYGRPIDSELQGNDPTSVLRRAVESMEPLARQHGVTLRCDLPATLPQIRMDRQRLLQVFENLLKNAIEHSADGGEVQMRAAVSEDASLIVEVADRGRGIAAEDLPRLFEPFFTRRRGGTGLGLSLVRRIVDEHHGTIRAGNREGGGALMVVTLPLAEAAKTR